ncbi:cell filamentation protein Fic [Haloarcula rubripromontorii]|uniref:Cell filamentation protein Fic n=1 Tax=Haloarcula rubripromontorii TaxID=1705562 RepID=A0A847TJA2_9EURY|nr:cell filamentation protein Fic [Haloarcula rubripromontorii]
MRNRTPLTSATLGDELLDLTPQTARNVIRGLVAQDILTETTENEQYQEFKTVDIFDILDQPLE